MTTNHLEDLYNRDLENFEKLLLNVRRPGSFFISGSKEIPLPRVEIDGVGTLSFPVPEEQIKKIIQQAVRAPHGRGTETILDTSVRKVWQITPEKVKISGSSWAANFASILSMVKDGLGCQNISVTAELYKLLVYDVGGFFLAHRDTEKSPGMFGTMVIVLPSSHSGGELVIRHAGQEVLVSLKGLEFSELTFAAFYADCEHEVKPITEGNRICLVYNLIQHRVSKGEKNGQPLIKAPIYNAEITAATKILEDAFKPENSLTKIAWLLEHQYSSAELSFLTLKNADAALAQVLTQAAIRADCAIHLGIVHLEDCGSAEANYEGYSRNSRWRDYDDENENEDNEGYEESFSEDFEILDICDIEQYIDGWVNIQNRSIDFGKLPLDSGELLPVGVLDDETPDEQRLMEATGNEGASYERAYHRAALVIWPNSGYAKVLLQAGASAAMAYLKECVDSPSRTFASGDPLKEPRDLADLIITHWETTSQYSSFLKKGKCPDRSEMLRLIGRLEDPSLLERFISSILIKEYDGSENSALVLTINLLDTDQIGNLLSNLIKANMRLHSGSCIDLIKRLIKGNKGKLSTARHDAIQKLAIAVVTGLKDIGQDSASTGFETAWRERHAKPLDFNFIIELWGVLKKIEAIQLEDLAATEIISRSSVFDPGEIIVPALKQMQGQYNGESLVRLWQHSCEFLLKRSEFPPEPPKDWRQDIRISCNCNDCKELQAFALNPASQTNRFRVKKERRQHLHQIIDRHKMDMTHSTERIGSPQTLVCTKTRQRHELILRQYRADIATMKILHSLHIEMSSRVTEWKTKLIAAINRS